MKFKKFIREVEKEEQKEIDKILAGEKIFLYGNMLMEMDIPKEISKRRRPIL